MPEAPYDLKSKHPLLPHQQVSKLFTEEEFRYEKKPYERAYQDWYDEVKKSKITILINQFYRTRRLIESKSKDFIYYDAILQGTDRKGNMTGFDIRLGLYDKPTFRKQIDDRTDSIISHEISGWTTVYEYEYTPEMFDDLLLQAREDDLHLNVVSPGRTYSIPDVQDFRDANYQELVEIGKTGKSLHSIRAAAPPTPTPTTAKKKPEP